MAIHASAASFNLALKKYGQTTVPGLMQGRMAVIAFTAAKSLTELTPVDRGRAKGNWQTTLREPAEGEVERLDPSKKGSPGVPAMMEALERVQGWQPGEWVWFHNGVPYITYLNDGTERTEAHHMLERTAEYLRDWLKV